MTDIVERLHQELDAIRRAVPDQYLLAPLDGGGVKTVEGIGRMTSEIERLRAENARLREAMKPFARESNSWTFGPHSDNLELSISRYDSSKAFCTFTFGDLRRAAAALEENT